jgi:Mobilization protein NikA
VPSRKGEESRDRHRHLKVVVSARERAAIETRAAATGLSVSAYLRNLGLGFQPHSTLDQEAILALLKVNADQGRLGGLFKLWLSGQSAPSAEVAEIRKLLAAIEESQVKLKALIGQLSDWTQD